MGGFPWPLHLSSLGCIRLCRYPPHSPCVGRPGSYLIPCIWGPNTCTLPAWFCSRGGVSERLPTLPLALHQVSALPLGGPGGLVDSTLQFRECIMSPDQRQHLASCMCPYRLSCMAVHNLAHPLPPLQTTS